MGVQMHPLIALLSLPGIVELPAPSGRFRRGMAETLTLFFPGAGVSGVTDFFGPLCSCNLLAPPNGDEGVTQVHTIRDMLRIRVCLSCFHLLHLLVVY